MVEPAAKQIAADGATTVTASETEVWVEAVEKGKASVVKRADPVHDRRVHRRAKRRNVYGSPTSSPWRSRSTGATTSPTCSTRSPSATRRSTTWTLARWYPTLVGLEDGRVLAVSGLDGFGRIIHGHNEIYDPETRQWTTHPELQRTFPTYPALFLMPNGKLFYSGSNAGYGSATVGRHPGHLGPRATTPSRRSRACGTRSRPRPAAACCCRPPRTSGT